VRQPLVFKSWSSRLRATRYLSHLPPAERTVQEIICIALVCCLYMRCRPSGSYGVSRNILVERGRPRLDPRSISTTTAFTGRKGLMRWQ
jgi:hypothetical protein